MSHEKRLEALRMVDAYIMLERKLTSDLVAEPGISDETMDARMKALTYIATDIIPDEIAYWKNVANQMEE